MSRYAVDIDDIAAPLLTPEQAARFLGVGEDTLRAMRLAGEIAYINIGRGQKRETPRYDVADLMEWREKKRQTACPSTSTKSQKTASSRMTSKSVVSDFQAALAKRHAAKQKPKKGA